MNVLVTGASSGIGLSISKYMLELGYNLYVVSTNKKELDNIYKKYKDRVMCIGLDLSNTNNCYKLYNMLCDKDIDVVINNASFGETGNFTETSINKELKMIDVNIVAYHILTKLFLRDMVKNNKGYILNVSSMAGFMPGPYMATYYATKSYITNFSLSIYEELKRDNSNVRIAIFCPGPVRTNFEKRANVKFNTSLISSDYAARYAISNMFKNKLIIIPPNMKLNYLLVKLAPISLILKINSKIQERI